MNGKSTQGPVCGWGKPQVGPLPFIDNCSFVDYNIEYNKGNVYFEFAFAKIANDM